MLNLFMNPPIRRAWTPLVLVLAVLFTPSLAQAQLRKAGTPPSFTQRASSAALVKAITTPALDMRALEQEDKLDGENGMPPRFGYPHLVSLDLLQQGQQEVLPNNTRIWRHRIQCPRAISINLLYERFWLPPGGELYIYSADRRQVLGAFTSANNKGPQENPARFATGLLFTDEIILEYTEPASVEESAIIEIAKIVHGYRLITPPEGFSGRVFGSSGSCQVNVNCPEGANWQDEKKGVAMILVNGTRWCSGSLLNNTSGDGDLLFLTADHCLTGSLDAVSNPTANDWSFAWEYESPGCANQNPGALQTTVGATLLANDTETDFALFRLTEDPRAANYDVYFNGWDRTSSPGVGGVGIHHPSGDIKKISTHSSTPGNMTFGSRPANAFWRIFWDATTNGHSVTEGGSSGSPLFNSSGHVIGQLYGGSSLNCSDPANDVGGYGKIQLSWDGFSSGAQRRLRDWLDPAGTAPNSVNGAYIAGNGGGGDQCSGNVSSFPYTENFESGITWNQSTGDDFNWAQNSGGTPSNNTGPTAAGQGTFYAYMEVSNPNFPSKSAIITSPCFDLTSVTDPEISFQYHALGANVGTLVLEASTDGSSWTSLWSITGDQGSAWQDATVSLSAYSTATELRLRFRGTSGSSWDGDICVDDIRVGAASGGGGNNCTTTITAFPYTQNFDGLALCQNTLFACASDGGCALGAGWANATGEGADWSVDDAATPSGNTGPSADHTSGSGRYLFTEASSCFNNTMQVLSPCFDLSGQSDATLTFFYHMWGASMGTLSVQASTDNGTTWSGNLWSQSGDQGNSWQEANVSLASYAGATVRLRFTGNTGAAYTSDIAIDDVSIGTGGGGGCPAIDFSSTTVSAYGSGQDNGSHAVQDGGATLFLQNNAWKSISYNYTVTANTVVEFDFRSTLEGEIHGIGFDNDDAISSNLTFKVHGTQAWGITSFDNYSPTGWTTYTIPVGASYTGSYDRLFFVSDHDASPSNGNSYFRNVKIYEGSCSEALGESAGANPEPPAAVSAFQISPNPFHSTLGVQVPDFELPGITTEVALYDLMGKEVYRMGGIEGRSFEIQPDVPAGAYILRLRAGTYAEDHKVIKFQ